MQSKQKKLTEFGQFHILKIGQKYIHAELIGSTKNYRSQLIKNPVVSDIEIGETVFLRVKDQSIKSGFGTKVIFDPIERLTDEAEIEKYILAERKRVAEIYIQAAQENLNKGWYGGDAIEKALLFSASHPTYKTINIELRHKRLSNIIRACCSYKHKTTEQFIRLCTSASEMYQDEQLLNDLELKQFEQDMITIQSEFDLAKKAFAKNTHEYLNQLKGLLKK